MELLRIGPKEKLGHFGPLCWLAGMIVLARVFWFASVTRGWYLVRAYALWRDINRLYIVGTLRILYSVQMSHLHATMMHVDLRVRSSSANGCPSKCSISSLHLGMSRINPETATPLTPIHASHHVMQCQQLTYQSSH